MLQCCDKALTSMSSNWNVKLYSYLKQISCIYDLLYFISISQIDCMRQKYTLLDNRTLQNAYRISLPLSVTVLLLFYFFRVTLCKSRDFMIQKPYSHRKRFYFCQNPLSAEFDAKLFSNKGVSQLYFIHIIQIQMYS